MAKKPSFWLRKSSPGASRERLGSARTSQVERKNAARAPSDSRAYIFLPVERSQSQRVGRNAAKRGASAGIHPNPGMRICEWTRCTYLGAACKTLARKLWVGSWKSYGQARAAKRKTKAIAARFVLRFVDRALSANELLRSRRLAACGRQVVLRSSAESQQRRRSNEKSTQHRPQIDQNSTKNR